MAIFDYRCIGRIRRGNVPYFLLRQAIMSLARHGAKTNCSSWQKNWASSFTLWKWMFLVRSRFKNALNSLPEHLAEIDCLINNAGLALGLDTADKADFGDWETMIQTNIIGLTFLTRQILPQW